MCLLNNRARLDRHLMTGYRPSGGQPYEVLEVPTAIAVGPHSTWDRYTVTDGGNKVHALSVGAPLVVGDLRLPIRIAVAQDLADLEFDGIGDVEATGGPPSEGTFDVLVWRDGQPTVIPTLREDELVERGVAADGQTGNLSCSAIVSGRRTVHVRPELAGAWTLKGYLANGTIVTIATGTTADMYTLTPNPFVMLTLEGNVGSAIFHSSDRG